MSSAEHAASSIRFMLVTCSSGITLHFAKHEPFLKHGRLVFTSHWSLDLSLDGLKQKVENCTHMTQKEFSLAERQDIVKYLNDQFYRFQWSEGTGSGMAHSVFMQHTKPDPLDARSSRLCKSDGTDV